MSPNFLRHVPVAAVALACAAGPACAQTAPVTLDPAQIIANADANGDKMISRQEYLTERSKMFARLDRDGNGMLAPTEFTAAANGRVYRAQSGYLFRQFDANGDGAISLAEFNAAPAPAFDRLDANHDGMLSQQEIQAARRR